ncbi:ABC transporter permease [Microbacterium album]|uniref:Nitrate ABC transporter permease n=1 Tax=Microbacterium album TaxID=2053191 RepID=A0A917IDJ1_9MICO|nr:ABC transporter permease [Microbacterium album]GGH33502.1 nitrate ABC transporter permease [Microbacterium album]
MMKRRAADFGMGLILPLLLIALWWVTSTAADSFYFPPLPHVLDVFADLWVFDLVPVHVFPSLAAIGLGLGISIVLGVALGVLLGLSRFVSDMVSPVLQFLRYLPAVALLPLAIQLIGIGLEMRVLIIVLGAIWPILLNTMDGVRGIHPAVGDVARSTRLDGPTWIFRIVLPAASPQIFTGIRASLAVAVVLMVASELLGSSRGMGYFILESQRQFSIPEMWSGMILLGIIGYLLNVIFGRVEHHVLAWHRLSRS